MAGSRLARGADLARGLQRDAQRIRRLEVNDPLLPPPVPVAASATVQYSPFGPPAAAAYFDPDFTAGTLSEYGISVTVATGTEDGGLPAGGNVSGFVLPAGWVYAANCSFEITTPTPPPTGEVLRWYLENLPLGTEGPHGSYKLDPIYDTTAAFAPSQRFGTSVAATGSDGSVTGAIGAQIMMGRIETVLGTLFTPKLFVLEVWAVKVASFQGFFGTGALV